MFIMFIVLMCHTYVLVIIIIVRFISNLSKLSSAYCLSLIERLIGSFLQCAAKCKLF